MTPSAQLGVVAAGHPLSARAGANVLAEGGNAVDAALGAMLVSFVCEPLLTGLGAGGYMLVVAPGREPTLLDFFVGAPGHGEVTGQRAELLPVPVSFGDAIQVFNIGAASVGTFGMPAGVCEAALRFGRIPLERLVEPAAALARHGVEVTAQQAYIAEILGGIVTSTPEGAALFAPRGSLLHAGERMFQPELGDTLQRLGSEGAQPFYRGDIAGAITDWVVAHGGILTRADLEAYRVVDRPPLLVSYRGREVLTNPPPSAGGILIARALALLDAQSDPGAPPVRPSVDQIIAVMAQTQRERTPEFLAGLDDPDYVQRFLSSRGTELGADQRPEEAARTRARCGRLGSTTHIAVLDREGWACSVTCSNGSCSGVVVPGTGIHLNNMLGEQDLNPLGFHRHPAGRRLPSMMAPTVVIRDGVAELAVGSAGSNRIRSAILQTVIRTIDDGLTAQAAVDAPRVHYEDGIVYTEPGLPTGELEASGWALSPFRERNLFFGGAQAVARNTAGSFSGGGDPRRGGAAIVVCEP